MKALFKNGKEILLNKQSQDEGVLLKGYLEGLNNKIVKGKPLYDINKKFSGIALELDSGEEGYDWDSLGFEGEPESLRNLTEDGYNYAKYIQDNWDESLINYSYLFHEDKNLIFFPKVKINPNVNIFYGMFEYCTNLMEVADLDMSNVEYAYTLFSYCRALVKLPVLHIPRLIDAANMFLDCSNIEEINLVDADSLSDLCGMFFNCERLKRVLISSTENVPVLSVENLFCGCRSLEEAPMLNTSLLTSMESIFFNCESLRRVPNYDTSNVENFNNAFCNCRILEDISTLDTSSAVFMQNAFRGCIGLINIPNFNLSNLERADGMFAYCYALESVPAFDLSNVTVAYEMFRECGELKDVPIFDLSSVRADGLTNMYYNCNKLTDESLNNILITFSRMTNFEGTKTLVEAGFSSEYYPAERIEVLPAYQDFLDAGWTIGY